VALPQVHLQEDRCSGPQRVAIAVRGNTPRIYGTQSPLWLSELFSRMIALELFRLEKRSNHF